MSAPRNVRLALAGFSSPEDPIYLRIANETLGSSLGLALPTDHDKDLTLDFESLGISDETGAPRPDLLAPEERSLWVPRPLRSDADAISLRAIDGVVARDDFDGHTSGQALSAQVAESGGNWDESGDTTDFTTATGGVVRRTALADSNAYTGGQFVHLDGTGATTQCEVQADIALPAHAVEGKSIVGAVIARFVDTSNYLIGYRAHYYVWGQSATFVRLVKVVAGTPTILDQLDTVGGHYSGYVTLKLTAAADGDVRLWQAAAGFPLSVVGSADNDAAIATSGALDNGKVGLYDGTDLASGSYSRAYNNFLATSEGPAPAAYGVTAALSFDPAY